ncbi:unnamed protein product [Candidula unifasciata]|uniref:Uncharacterized protein n=1 Tax=Candidula unifasciata TaxID=100452 RepID=A0A8S4A8S1_9EUPU|nr:unnamed protein product [Candidula unifasciata]
MLFVTLLKNHNKNSTDRNNCFQRFYYTPSECLHTQNFFLGKLFKAFIAAILIVFLLTVYGANYELHRDFLSLIKPIYNTEYENSSTAEYLDSGKQATKQLKLIPNNSSDISEAYRKKWIGFPEMYGRDCPTALKTKVNTIIFPSEVKRTHPIDIIADASDCKSFIEKYGYNRYLAASQEELDFPIAFIILFYSDLDQALYLLRSLYHQHNVYCLSVDTSVSVDFLRAVKLVAKCLPNVFVASKLEHVVYAGFSRLQSDINCMKDLLKHPVQWKYAINMAGQEFPLRTNLEMVKILKIYNGANDILGFTGERTFAHWHGVKAEYYTDTKTGKKGIYRTGKKHPPPPHNITVSKGSAYGTFSRAFVQFVIHDPVAKDLLQWAKEIYSPDEFYWATLQHSSVVAVPGGYTGKPDLKPWLTKYVSWSTDNEPCATIHTRLICIFRYELFANKFYITHQPAALHCLDEFLFNLTFTRSTRNLTYYNSLPFILKGN